MLGDRSRLLRLVLLAATVFAAVAWPVRHHTAHAATAGDDDDAADADQPAVTAGGLYTNKTYPLSVIDRPLTLIAGMTEVKAGIASNLSEGATFQDFVLGIGAHYGINDNQEIQFAFATGL